MDIALMTPVAEGRQGADSKERPAEVRRSGPEPHFWEISELTFKTHAQPNRGLPRNREKNPHFSEGGPSGARLFVFQGF